MNTSIRWTISLAWVSALLFACSSHALAQYHYGDWTADFSGSTCTIATDGQSANALTIQMVSLQEMHDSTIVWGPQHLGNMSNTNVSSLTDTVSGVTYMMFNYSGDFTSKGHVVLFYVMTSSPVKINGIQYGANSTKMSLQISSW
eukprot:TRINITY_DN16478_c0_g1_i1.p1 TRINITY_DN16478_c0_g1~~TRINITY_DN16478_c0_g1_i1.p1  ORF type:complete len:145 (+),score=4.53 TRINITY_DN16478_c0_g1_i1:406-840(+)